MCTKQVQFDDCRLQSAVSEIIVVLHIFSRRYVVRINEMSEDEDCMMKQDPVVKRTAWTGDLSCQPRSVLNPTSSMSTVALT